MQDTSGSHLTERRETIAMLRELERKVLWLASVSYTHLTLPTTIGWCIYRWSPYN